MRRGGHRDEFDLDLDLDEPREQTRDYAGSDTRAVAARPVKARQPQLGRAVAGAALVAAGLAGFVIGEHAQASTATAHSTPQPSTARAIAAEPVESLSVSDTCSTRVAQAVHLGLKLYNQGKDAVVVRRLAPQDAVPGLRSIGMRLGMCGEGQEGSVVGYRIEPGASAWFTDSVEVREDCPWGHGYSVDLSYTAEHRRVSARLEPFGTRTDVAAPGCTS